MQSLQSFINKHRIRLDASLTGTNPNMAADDKWMHGATHWKCVLKCGKRQMTTFFSQGSAISREPTAADLLDCLASDVVGVLNASDFEDWCREYGYDPDSRKAEKIYRTCQDQADALEQLIGASEAYETLLYNTERL